MSAVPSILKFSPVALEMMDETVFRNFDDNPSSKAMNKDVRYHCGDGCL